MNSPKQIQRKTACNRDCPDACAIVATIEDGRVVRIQGDKDHPITRGFLCKRTSRFLDRQYHRSRITRPLVRTGSKSEENWTEVSLDTALDLVAEKLLHFRDTSGPASILNYRCGGSMGMMKYVTDYFFQEFGPVTIKSGDVCSGAGDIAQETDFGHVDSNDIHDLYNAHSIILWGKNVYVSHVHLLPVLKECKSRGIKVILIDPVRHRTADLCDHYIQNRPGGDGALAMAIAATLLAQEKLHPSAEQWCDHFESYCALVRSKTPGQWSELAGVTTEQLALLAETYSAGPSTILAGWGMQRRSNGANTMRSIDALACVTGNIGIPGAGVSYYFARRGAFDVSFKDDSLAPRRIPEPLLGTGIENASDPPIEMVMVSAANPVANIPDSNVVARALRDRFTVVIDYQMTDTARCADVILPTVTMLEEDDLLGAYGHHYLAEMRPVVDAPDDAKTDYEIMQLLAARVGLDEQFAGDAQWWKRKMTDGLKTQGITLENIRDDFVRNPYAPKILFEGRKFHTESGKANLVTEYVPHKPREQTEFPLRLMAISTDEAQAAQWQPEQQQGPATVTVHPDAAKEFRDGETAILKSDLAEITVVVKFDARQRGEVALMDKGGWLASGRCANVLTRGELSDDGQCAVYYETPVRLVKVSGN